MQLTSKINWLEAPSKQGLEVYELWDEDQKRIKLEFNQFSQTAQILCLNSRRVFKIEKEGFLRNRIVFKNEYGVKIGDVSDENWLKHEGIVNLNGDKLYFTTHCEEENTLLLYRKEPQKPLMQCGIMLNNGKNHFKLHKHSEADKYPALLIALVWYLVLTTSEKTIDNKLNALIT